MWRACPKCKGMAKQSPCDRCELISSAASPTGYVSGYEEAIALSALFDAYQKLKALGWREAIYCPKDGSTFLTIEAGSTGTNDTLYMGNSPNGGCWIMSGGDLWPAHPILWKPKET